MNKAKISKDILKDMLIKNIQEDKSFKKDFLSNPNTAIGSRFGLEVLENINLTIDKDTCGIMHVKISDKNSNKVDDKDNFIHLIMLCK